MAGGNLALTVEGLAVVRQSQDVIFSLSAPAFRLRNGSRVALVGPSGCGKSTLLDCLALLLQPKRVDRFVLERPGVGIADIAPHLRRWQDDTLADIRRLALGYVPQTGGLLPFLSVERNVALSCTLAGIPPDGRVARILRDVGLERHRHKKPGALSVGERQRVAIARALVHEPLIVIADEPTSALDPQTADRILSLLVHEAERRNVALLVATHDVERIRRFDFAFADHRFQAGASPRHIESVFHVDS